MSSIAQAAEYLTDGWRRFGLKGQFSPASHRTLESISLAIPVSVELRQWYQLGGPVNIEIPWFVEWLRLYSAEELVYCQGGYRWRGDNQTDLIADWNASWIAIGDWSGDPIIVDTAETEAPVYTAIHGVGTWRPIKIAPSLAVFLQALGLWAETCLVQFGGTFVDDEEAYLLPEVAAVLRTKLTRILPQECHAFWLRERP